MEALFIKKNLKIIKLLKLTKYIENSYNDKIYLFKLRIFTSKIFDLEI